MARTDLNVDRFRRRLVKDRAKAVAERDGVTGIFDESESDETGELTTHDDHLADIASDLFERERDLLLGDNLQQIIGQIDHALQKMKDGTYGLCDTCLREIPKERLELVPYAALCIEDQAKVEGTE